MHCLLCHEKIPRFRYWRTKSEFCCDEHAAIHRRQTLERLVGHAAGSPEENLTALSKDASKSEAPPLPTDSVQERASQSQDEQDARTERAEQTASLDSAEMPPELSGDTESLPGDGDQAVEPDVAAVEAASTIEADQADADDEPAVEEPELVGEAEIEEELARALQEAELEYEDSTGEDKLLADDFEEQEELEEEASPYFEAASVQRDEPFPVEVQAAESHESEPPHEPEPLEPSMASEESETLLDLLAMESAGRADALTSSKEEEITPAADLLAVDLPDVEQLSAEDAVLESSEPETAGGEHSSDENPAAETAPEPAAEDTSEPETAEQVAAVSQAEQPAPAEVTSETPPVQEQPAEPPAASPPVAKAKQAGNRFGLKPLKAWDPSRARRKKGQKGGQSLNRLSEGLGDQDSKLRSMGPGGEIRREGGRDSKLVCFLPVQGGNGASTVSLHVAEAISHHLNERVLLADFDFHSGTLAFRLGLKPVHTLGDAFMWEQERDQLWEKVVCRWKKLDVLVSPPSNSSIRPQSLDNLPDIFLSALRRYPYVIVDHPDAIYSSSKSILRLSDLVYLVCTPEITSLHLARRKVQQIRAMGVPGERLRLIVNRTGSWGSLGVGDVGKIVGVPVSWALNNDYAALRDAVWNGGLVQDGSELARQLRELGWSVMGVDAPVVAESAAPAEVTSPVG